MCLPLSAMKKSGEGGDQCKKAQLFRKISDNRTEEET